MSGGSGHIQHAGRPEASPLTAPCPARTGPARGSSGVAQQGHATASCGPEPDRCRLLFADLERPDLDAGAAATAPPTPDALAQIPVAAPKATVATAAPPQVAGAPAPPPATTMTTVPASSAPPAPSPPRPLPLRQVGPGLRRHVLTVPGQIVDDIRPGGRQQHRSGNRNGPEETHAGQETAP